MKTFAAIILALSVASTAALAQTSVSPSEAESRPENMAAGPDGTLYIGSQKDARIYRAAPGQAVAQPFIDMRPSAFVLGVLADGASNTLWACEMVSMNRGSPLLKGKGILRSFDLKTRGAEGEYPAARGHQYLQRFRRRPGQGAVYRRHLQRQDPAPAPRRHQL